MFREAADEETLNQGLDLGLAKVQEVPGHIEGKPVHVIGAAEPARFLLLLHHATGTVSQVVRRAEPGQAGPVDEDHRVLLADSAAGRRWRIFCEEFDILTCLSQTAVTTANVTAVLTGARAVSDDTLIRNSPTPP